MSACEIARTSVTFALGYIVRKYPADSETLTMDLKHNSRCCPWCFGISTALFLTLLRPSDDLLSSAHDRQSQRTPHTLYDKIWNDHVVHEEADGTCLLYVDRHLVRRGGQSAGVCAACGSAGLPGEVTRKTLLVVDHNVPTSDRGKPNPDPASAAQIAYFAENAPLFGLEYYDELDPRQGICHVVGPEQGFTLPGTMIVCGDSHTTTHGAFGALAYGIGTTEIEHVLATQTLIQRKSNNMRAVIDGVLPPDVSAKDIILALIGEIGAAGAHRPCAGICGRCGPRAFDGRPHDPLQHVGRGRRANRHHRAGRKDFDVSERPAEIADGRGLGRGHALLGNAAHR